MVFFYDGEAEAQFSHCCGMVCTLLGLPDISLPVFQEQTPLSCPVGWSAAALEALGVGCFIAEGRVSN